MKQSSFLQGVPTRRGHSVLASVTFDFVTHSRRLSRLRVDYLDIRDIDPGLLVDDPAAAISGRLLMSLDHPGCFDFHLAAEWRHRQYAAALSFVAASHHDHLIVLSNFGSLSGFHNQMTSGANETIFM
jgi:hypothetical protein